MLETLSRLQFAVTILFHFLFVPVSIGTILLIAIYETLHVVKKDDKYRKLGDYFGNVFIIMYAVGIVTGIAMSVQFGTNWSNYSTFMGNVFGAPLALEALLAFFLESTFTGIWIIARKKISANFRMITAWLIWFGTSLSSLWIITANGFMQHPVGYQLSSDGTHVMLTSIKDLVLNPYAWYMLGHTVTSAYLLGAFVIISVASAKLIKSTTLDYDRQVFKSAFKVAGIVGLITGILVPSIAGAYTAYIAQVQPEKMQAIGGANEFVRICFLLMVSVGTLMIIISFLLTIVPDKFINNPSFLKVLKWSFILPYIGINAGWIVAEVGRQPWAVYGLLKTSESYSHVPVSEVAFSIICIVILYACLYGLVIHLLKVQINKPLGFDSYTHKNKFKDSLGG
ncbi:MAG: cytochrome ubiquinol oxidase subunit I [Mycoplasmatales bacterium]